MSTGASRAWLVVAATGFVVVALVLGLRLIPRLGAGQRLVDAAGPAFTKDRMQGTRAGVNLFGQFVDFADPLVARRRAAEARELVAFVGRRLDLTSAQARRLVRRRAPHLSALLRALPLAGAAAQVPDMTDFLTSTLATTPDDLQTTLLQRFGRLAQALGALRNMTSGWDGVPGVEGRLTRPSGAAVATAPQLRDYLRDDLVARLARNRERFEDLGGSGGLGIVPYLVLAFGVGMLAFGLFQASASARRPAGKLAWGIVVAAGALFAAVVVVLSLVPRLSGGHQLADELDPVLTQARVDGMLAGGDFVHEALAFGDPVATARGGAKADLRRLIEFVGASSALDERQARRGLTRTAPRLMALLTAMPLNAVADEADRLLRLLARHGKDEPRELLDRLDRDAPGLARSLEAVGRVAPVWSRVPGMGGLTRLDGVTPVRSLGEFDGYLREDLIATLRAQRGHFDTLANTWPPMNLLAPLVTAIAGLLAWYAVIMMFLVTPTRDGP